MLRVAAIGESCVQGWTALGKGLPLRSGATFLICLALSSITRPGFAGETMLQDGNRPAQLSSKMQISILADRPSPSGRTLFLLLAPQDFTEDKLRTIFTGLATRFRSPTELEITAYSDKEMLAKQIALYDPLPVGTPIADGPGVNTGRLPAKSGYLRAHFQRRRDGQEEFSYSPNAQSEEVLTIVIRFKKIPYTGDPLEDLLLAIQEGDERKVAQLLGSSTNPKVKNADGDSAVALAALYSRPVMMRALLGRGAAADTSNRMGWTPLMYVAAHGTVEEARILLERGVDPNARNSSGDSALHLSSFNRQTEIVRTLLLYGAEVNGENSEGNTPLINGAMAGNAEIVGMLLRAGARAGEANNQGRTALDYTKDPGVATLLREAAARLTLEHR